MNRLQRALKTADLYSTPFLCLATPITFFLILYNLVVSPAQWIISNKLDPNHPKSPIESADLSLLGSASCNAHSFWTGKKSFNNNKFLASDLSGYYDFSISSSFLILFSVVAVVGAVWATRHFRHREHGLILFTLALATSIGLVACLIIDNKPGLRGLLILPIQDFARESLNAISPQPKAALVASDSFDLSRNIISINLYSVSFAVMSILATLSALFWPRANVKNPALVLRDQIFVLRAGLFLVSIPLVLTVITSRAAGNWSLSLLCVDQRTNLQPIVNAIANYWGAGTSGVIVCGFSPALIKWLLDRERLMECQHFPSRKLRQDWLDEEGLAFSLSGTLFSVLAVGFPALAAPLSSFLTLLV